MRIQAALNKENKRKDAKKMVNAKDASSAVGQKILDEFAKEKEQKLKKEEELNKKLKGLSTIERVHAKNEFRK